MKYNFIEIGTSDFNTLIEVCDDKEFGISIEPLQEYLHLLPDKENVKKVNCAVSDKNEIVKIFYVEIDDINNHGLPSWIRGCNSINNPHKSTMDVLKERNLEHLMKSRDCEAITWDTLVERFEVESVAYLKIDAEGHDCTIVRNIIFSESPVRPEKILFENNVLTDQEFFKETLVILSHNNYDIIESSGENVIVKKRNES